MNSNTRAGQYMAGSPARGLHQFYSEGQDLPSYLASHYGLKTAQQPWSSSLNGSSRSNGGRYGRHLGWQEGESSGSGSRDRDTDRLASLEKELAMMREMAELRSTDDGRSGREKSRFPDSSDRLSGFKGSSMRSTSREGLSRYNSFKEDRYSSKYKARDQYSSSFERSGSSPTRSDPLAMILDDALSQAKNQRDFSEDSCLALQELASRMGFQITQGDGHQPQIRGVDDKRDMLLDTSLDLLHHVADISRLLQEVCNHSATLVGADEVTLFFLNNSRDGFEDPITGKVYPKTGIVALVSDLCAPISIFYPENHQSFDPRIDVPKARGYLCLPLMYGGTVKGVARAMRMKSPRMFRPTDEAVFKEFLLFTQVTLQNAEMLRGAEFAKEKTEAILEISKHLAEDSLDNQQLVDTVLETARSLTHAARATIYFVDDQELRAYFDDNTVSRASITKGIAGWVASNATTVVVEDVSKDDRFDMEVDRVEQGLNVMYVPVQGKDQIMAVCQLVNTPGRIFSREDAEMFFAFSSFAGIAIRNCNTFNALKKQEETAQSALRLTETLANAGLEEAQFADIFIEQSKKIFSARRCILFEVDELGLRKQAGTHGPPKSPLSTNQRYSKARGIAGLVASTGKIVRITEPQDNPHFDFQIDEAAQTSMLCVPVKADDKIIAVAQIVDKDAQLEFTDDDEKLFALFSGFVGLMHRNAKQHSTILNNTRKMDVLMNVLVHLNQSDIRKVDSIIERIIEGAQDLLDAERCSLFCVDRESNELYSKVASGTGGKQIRFRMTSGIAGEVARTKKPLNIANAYEDPRFNKDIDQKLGFRTRSLLTFPVIHESDVVAVCQIMNKRKGPFDREDEELFEIFAMFAGISLANASTLEFAVQASQAQTKLMNLMDGNKSTNDELTSENNGGRDITKIISAPILDEELFAYMDAYEMLTETEKSLVTSKNFNIHTYKNAAYGTTEYFKVIPFIVHLLHDLGCVKELNLDIKILIRFLCRVRNLYRFVPYHNWFHAVDVVQTMYLFIRTLDPHQPFNTLDKYVLMIAGVVHDVDHMGLNNSFHLKVESPMGILSSCTGTVSVLEVHHCNVAIQVMNDQLTNVFHSLDVTQKTYAYKAMVTTILATDMAKHGELLKSFKELPKLKEDPNPDENKATFMKMLIKSCDVSNVAKPYEVAREWALAVVEEFYTQGDMEKEQGFDILPMFDRHKADLAKGQVGFINFLAIGEFKAIEAWYEGFGWTIQGIESVRDNWQKIIDEDAKKSEEEAKKLEEVKAKEGGNEEKKE